MSSNGGGGSNLLDMGLMIAAGVAAPELAPVLFEGGIAGSATAATALTGAALSGAAGAVTGQNVARSAGIGALGGALSGALGPASGGAGDLGAVPDVAPVSEGAPIPAEGGDIATNAQGQMLTPQGAVVNPQASTAGFGNAQDLEDMAAGQSAGKVPVGTGATANTYMPNAPGAMGSNFLGVGPATNLQMGVAGLTNLYGYQAPRPGAYTPPPYKGGPLQKFKYDPNNYQPDVVKPPSPLYQAQYAEGGITKLSIGGDYSASASNPNGPLTQPSGGIGSIVAQAVGNQRAATMQGPDGTMNLVYDPKTGNYVIPQKMAAGGMASGGISDLGSYSDGGRLLKGPGDGMSDSIPAMIGKKQEARLADGEFVVPADVVSGLGNGSTDAGAKHLYKMMDKVRHARTGRKSQAKQIKADKYVPA